MFKPAEAPKNMAPVDTTTTAVAVSLESAKGNHLTGSRRLALDGFHRTLVFTVLLMSGLGNIVQKASDIGNYLDDKLFGRNETVITFNEVKRIDPSVPLPWLTFPFSPCCLFF
jgi:hypothetical protein